MLVKKCVHNEKFFDNINEKSLYWAGFIAADGCLVHEKNKQEKLKIHLAIKDRNHLVKFKSDIKTTAKIHDYEYKHPSSTITITSKHIFDSLAKFNIVPRKTHIYTFPKWLINHKNVHHFMRGYFDGDGSIFISRKSKRFHLRGTTKFIKIYKNILVKNNINSIFSKGKNIRLNCGIGSLEFGGNIIVPKIGKFLYKNAKTYLQRKYDKFNIVL